MLTVRHTQTRHIRISGWKPRGPRLTTLPKHSYVHRSLRSTEQPVLQDCQACISQEQVPLSFLDPSSFSDGPLSMERSPGPSCAAFATWHITSRLALVFSPGHKTVTYTWQQRPCPFLCPSGPLPVSGSHRCLERPLLSYAFKVALTEPSFPRYLTKQNKTKHIDQHHIGESG